MGELDKLRSRRNNGEGFQWWAERKCHRYRFWAKRPELYKHEVVGLPYVFVDHGFFDLVWASMLPVLLVGHGLYFYAFYHLIHHGLWHMLPLCEYGSANRY